jgi:hypothetical protein
LRRHASRKIVRDAQFDVRGKLPIDLTPQFAAREQICHTSHGRHNFPS